MPFNLKYHGGECCGLTHVYDFPYFNKQRGENLKEVINRDISRNALDEFNFDDYKGESLLFNHCYEAVLTDHQLATGWDKFLKGMGFKHERRWFNSNSENHCNRLSYVSGRSRSKKGFNW